MTMYFVAGTQADNPSANSVTVMKASDMYRTQNDDGMAVTFARNISPTGLFTDSDESDDSDVDDDPILEFRKIPHKGGVNRIRVRNSIAMTEPAVTTDLRTGDATGSTYCCHMGRDW